MKEYAIAYGKDFGDLCGTVNKAIGDGYEPLGGAFVVGLEIGQAMWRDKPAKAASANDDTFKIVDEVGNNIGVSLLLDAAQPIEVGGKKYAVLKVEGDTATVREILPEPPAATIEAAPAAEVAAAVAQPAAESAPAAPVATDTAAVADTGAQSEQKVDSGSAAPAA